MHFGGDWTPQLENMTGFLAQGGFDLLRTFETSGYILYLYLISELSHTFAWNDKGICFLLVLLRNCINLFF